MMRTFVFATVLLLSSSLSAQVADVRVLGQTGRPATLPPGDFGDISVAIQNLGPDIARNLRVEFEASAGVRFTKLPFGNCSAANERIVCLYGDSAPGITYAGTEYTLPFTVGTHTVTATVFTDSSDPNASNNSVTVTKQTVQSAGVYASTFPRQVRLDPGHLTTIRAGVHREPRPRPTDTIPAGTVVEAQLSVTGGATIEAVDAPPFWNCTIAGATASCRALAPGGDCCGDFDVTVRAADDRDGGIVRLEVDAVAQRPSLDLPTRASTTVEVFRHLFVTTDRDSGAGSLRAAIEEINTRCATHSCRLFFEIGGSTIVLETPLPRIVADRLYIEGAQAILDGRIAGRGVEMHLACEGSVRGLTFRNFTENEGLWLAAGHPCDTPSAPWGGRWSIEGNRFEHNRRGLILDGAPFPLVRGNVIRDNRYSGIWMWRGGAWIESNRIENNGASGIFMGPEVRQTRVLSNTIAGHAEMGVAVAYGATLIEIGGNRMRDNHGLGIDWGLDGVTPRREDDEKTETNAPTLLSAVYDAAANRTDVTLSLRTRPMDRFPNTYAVIELFSNERPDGDGETPIRTWQAPHMDGTPFTIPVTGDLRGRWINATATRAVSLSPASRGSISTNIAGDAATTSELSNAILVSPSP